MPLMQEINFIMSKRQKWTSKEDKNLSRIVKEIGSDSKWDLVAYHMELAGHSKTAKQCRERFVNKLDASDRS